MPTRHKKRYSILLSDEIAERFERVARRRNGAKSAIIEEMLDRRLNPERYPLIDDVILNWRRHSNSLANTSNWSWAVLSVARGAIASRENTSCQRSAAAKALLDRCRTSRRDALRDLRQGNLRAAFKGILFTFVGYGTCGVSYVRSSRKLRRLPS